MARILRKMVITKRVSVTGHYINSRTSVQARRAFCCAVPAFLLPGGGKTGLQGEDLLEVEPLVCQIVARLESLKSLPIFGLKKGQKYSLFMGQVHNAFIINTTFI